MQMALGGNWIRQWLQTELSPNMCPCYQSHDLYSSRILKAKHILLGNALAGNFPTLQSYVPPTAAFGWRDPLLIASDAR